eukprot:symbB.v1.2.014150.t1/scaffold1028.1/size143234/2
MLLKRIVASRILQVQKAAQSDVLPRLTRAASTSVAASTQALALGAPVAGKPRVGSRMWYNLPGWQGPGGWVLWLVGWTTCAGFMQDFAGPYIFFHE